MAASATPLSALHQALRQARAGDWHAAHEIVQQHEGDSHADWIHAVLHRIEGDLGNARYWYRRCGRTPSETESPQAELARIADVLDDQQQTKPRRKGST